MPKSAAQKNIFPALSAAQSTIEIIALLDAVEIDAHIASHAAHTLARKMLPRESFDGESAKNIKRMAQALGGTHAALNSREISKAVWGLSKLWSNCTHVQGDILSGLHTLAGAAASAADGLDAQSVTGILHAFGTVAVPCAHASMHTLQCRAAKLASSGALGTQDMANMLWALARLNTPCDPALAGVLDEGRVLQKLLPRAKPMELSSTAWALAKLPTLLPPAQHESVMAALHAALQSDVRKGLSAQGAANCLWAVARCEPPPPPSLVASLLEQASQQAAALTPQGLANVCSSSARIGGSLEAVMMLLRGKPRAIEALGPVDVAEVAWSLGHMHGARRYRHCDRSGSAATPIDGFAPTICAIWQRAMAVAAELGWQESGLLDFSLRAIMAPPSPLADAAASAPSSGPLPPTVRQEGTRLLPLLASSAAAGFRAVKRERSTIEAAALGALLATHPLPWSTLPGGSRVLLAGACSAGRVCSKLRGMLIDEGLIVSTWNRFADARLPPECQPTASWPEGAATGGLFDAVLLRLPPSRAALDLALHAVATVLRPGGLLAIFGAREEGAYTTRQHLPPALFEATTTSACLDRQSGGHPAHRELVGGSVVLATRTPSSSDSASSAADERCSGVSGWEECTTVDLPGPSPEIAAAGGWSCVHHNHAGGATTATTATTTAIIAKDVPWMTLAGLFAGGGVDVMTKALLAVLPPLRRRARVLDFCCGSGVIAAALRARESTLRLHLLDADAVAVHAARHNVPGAAITLSDGWGALPKRPRFHMIVSNPPVHLGLQTDFRILRTLIAGAAKRLRANGSLWLVAQTYVPVRPLLEARRGLCGVRAAYDDGRFTVWTATRAARGRRSKQSAAATEVATGAARPAGPPGRLMTDVGREEEEASTSHAARGTATVNGGGPPSAAALVLSSSLKRAAAPIDRSMSKAQRKRARRKAAA